jgi:hypothetical protein
VQDSRAWAAALGVLSTYCRACCAAPRRCALHGGAARPARRAPRRSACRATGRCARAEAVDADFATVLDRIADKTGQAATRALADGLLERLADLATAYRADLVD